MKSEIDGAVVRERRTRVSGFVLITFGLVLTVCTVAVSAGGDRTGRVAFGKLAAFVGGGFLFESDASVGPKERAPKTNRGRTRPLGGVERTATRPFGKGALDPETPATCTTQIIGWPAANFNRPSFNMMSSYISQTSVNQVEEVWVGPQLASGSFVSQIRATIFTYKDNGQEHRAYVMLSVYVIDPSTGGTVTVAEATHSDLNAETSLACDVNRYVESNNYILCKLSMYRQTNTDVTEFHTLEVDTFAGAGVVNPPATTAVPAFNLYSREPSGAAGSIKKVL